MEKLDSDHQFTPFFLAIAFLLASLFVRPLIPVDETRYVAVAWEMWQRGDFLVPYLNGEPYSHKPPLLFWLIQCGWYLFGVNDWTPRLIGPLFSVLSLLVLGRLARRLWPERPAVAQLSRFLLLSFYFWAISSTLTMFDGMLSFFVLLGVYQLVVIASAGMTVDRFLALACAVALGILTKGPVILLHLVFIVLLAPLWSDALKAASRNYRRWYAGTLTAIFTGIALALCWVIPAAVLGGEVYRQDILWGQTSGRIVKSFAHQLPWWWYLEKLPLLLLPWILWPPVWYGIKSCRVLDAGLKFCLYWFFPVFICFSLISGKRLHYLLPLLPALALLIARLASTAETWPITGRKAQRPIAGLVLLVALIGLTLQALNGHFLWWPDVRKLSPLWFSALGVLSMVVLIRPTGSMVQSADRLCALTLVSTLLLAGAFFQVQAERYDVAETGQVIARLQRQGKQVFYLGKYHGEFNFAGRLAGDIRSIYSVSQWVSDFPGTYLICRYQSDSPVTSAKMIYQHADRGKKIGIFRHPSLDN